MFSRNLYFANWFVCPLAIHKSANSGNNERGLEAGNSFIEVFQNIPSIPRVREVSGDRDSRDHPKERNCSGVIIPSLGSI